MMKRLLFLGIILSMVACKGGDKAPVMETESLTEIDYNKPAVGHTAELDNQKMDVSVETEEGVLSIADVLSNREKYKGQTIKVKGKVTKYNPAIMGKNWVHIQDGSEHNGEFDLTITTAEQVQVGQVVVFTGIIALDRDFGYGYTYSTLMEAGLLQK